MVEEMVEAWSIAFPLVTAVWHWYCSTPAEDNRDTLVAISAVAVVVWTGGLIGLTLRNRYTAQLSNGIEAVQQAFLGPLFALVAHGPILRTLALVFAVYWFVAGVLLERLRRLVKRLKQRSGHYTLTLKPVEETPPLDQGKLRSLLGDALERATSAPKFALTSAACGIAVFVFASDTAMTWAALTLLVVGLWEIYKGLVDDFLVKLKTPPSLPSGITVTITEPEKRPPSPK